MNMKLIATSAAAALAFPAAAAADKPAEPGAHGKANAAEQKAKQKKQKKQKARSFTLKGVDVAGLTVTDGKLAGPVTLDPTSANRFARTFLDLTKAELKGEDTVTLGTAADAVLISYNGLTATDALQPTDTLKVIGRVKDGTLDIRKLVVTRETAEPPAQG
jgi:hypothetical protein